MPYANLKNIDLQTALIEFGSRLGFTTPKNDFKKAMKKASRKLANKKNGDVYLDNATESAIESWFKGIRYPKDGKAFTQLCEYIFEQQKSHPTCCNRAAFNKTLKQTQVIVSKGKSRKNKLEKQLNHSHTESNDNPQLNIKDVIGVVNKLGEKLSNQKNLPDEALPWIPPSGVDELANKKDETLAYRQNLSDEYLPYISRSEFKKTLPNNIGSAFSTEEDFYDSIFLENSEFYGAFIHGEGGVGKTRLMLQLGRTAQKNGWKVFQISNEFKGWDILQLPSNEKYCFIFDYVEENKHYDDNLIDLLTRQYKGITIKVLANSRDSYANENRFHKDHYKEIDLKTTTKPIERQFQSHVIRGILSSKCPHLFDEDNDFDVDKLIKRPSFAIFYLEGEKTRDDGTKINEDFHDIKEFSEYIKRRLSLTIKKSRKFFGAIDSEVFHLLSSLPIKKNKSYKAITTLLRNDGWIDFDTNEQKFKTTYNDTIIDELLIAYTDRFSDVDDLQDELIEFFDFTIENSEFENTFRSFDRIAPKSRRLEEIETKKILQVFENNNLISEIKKISKTFAKSQLISNPVDKIIFINRHDLLPFYDIDYTGTLSRAIGQVFNKENISKIKTLNRILVAWINFDKKKSERVFSKKTEGSFLIPKYYDYYRQLEGRLDGTTMPSIDIDSIALQWIKHYGHLTDADFIMNRYLQSEQSKPNEIVSAITYWVEKNNDGKEKAITLIINFLKNRNSDHSLIEALAKQLIISGNYFFKTKNKNGKILLFTIIQYLKKIDLENSIKLQQIYNSWILNNPIYAGTVFVIRNFFFNKGEYKIIKEGFNLWLEKGNPLIDEAGNIFQNIKLDTPIAKEPKLQLALINWLLENPNNMNTPFVIGNFFRNEGCYEHIEKAFNLWLGEEPLYEKAQIVFQNIDKSINDNPKLKHAYVEWINHNLTSSNLRFVLITFFNNDGVLKDININKKVASNFFGNIKINLSLNPLIEKAYIDWLNENYSSHSHFTYVIEQFRENYGNNDLLHTALSRFIQNNFLKQKKISIDDVFSEEGVNTLMKYYETNEIIDMLKLYNHFVLIFKLLQKVEETISEDEKESFYFLSSSYLRKASIYKKNHPDSPKALSANPNDLLLKSIETLSNIAYPSKKGIFHYLKARSYQELYNMTSNKQYKTDAINEYEASINNGYKKAKNYII